MFSLQIMRLAGLAVIAVSLLNGHCLAADSSTSSAKLLLEKVRNEGEARVILRIRDAVGATSKGGAAAALLNDGVWRERRERIISSLPGHIASRAKTYLRLPYLAVPADETTLQGLFGDDDVVEVFEDKRYRASLASSGAVLGSDIAHASGFSGAGSYVAVLDTGVAATHEMFNGKAIEEACFSTTYSPHSAVTLCPGGGQTAFGPGAALPCGQGGCDHGTHVAGIAVGNGSAFGEASGVARDADLIAIQVFSSFPTGISAYTSDIVAAMEYVYDLKVQQGLNIAAVNLSLGGNPVSSAYDCDFYQGSVTPVKAAADLLRSAGIATVAAAGNDQAINAMSAPGCITGVIGVGATLDSDAIPSYSNRSSWMSLMAPGNTIRSSTSAPAGYGTKSGTSMATPQVAGAFAVVRSAADSLGIEDADDVSRLLATMTANAAIVYDGATGREYPRLQLDDALAQVTTGWLPFVQVLDSDYAGGVVNGVFDLVVGSESYAGRYHLARPPVGGNRFRFEIDVPRTGYYSVSKWWPGGVGGPVGFRVSGDEGLFGGVLNQSAGGDSWLEIGVFKFSPTVEAFVEFSDDQGGQLVIDAVRVASVQTLQISTSSLPDAEMNLAYDFYLQVVGGIPPYTWSLSGGALPSGITLTADGRLSGVPTESGTFVVAVSVAESGGDSSVSSFSLHVAPGQNQPPVLTIASPAGGATFDSGTPVTFQATASDAESGDLGGAIVWQSDLDGALGSGPQVVASSLSVGTHTVTATVSDGELSSQQSVIVNIVTPGGGSGGDAIDFSGASLKSFPGQDVSGGSVVEDSGATLYLQGNTWKRLAYSYTVTADTVIEFDYRRTRQGEVHAIGFDNGESTASPSHYFALDGTQVVWNRSYSYTAAGGWQHFRIPVGQHFTGSFANLVFVMDDDAAAAGDARFRNVVLIVQ
ncbi:MAG: S8 family serine peptidase [Gammaproteobacteria bacterium]|nr:S8 family serine peptidase [Gammaproteobacteria bacterium]